MAPLGMVGGAHSIRMELGLRTKAVMLVGASSGTADGEIAFSTGMESYTRTSVSK